jgi:signal transduction histidine kinase
MRLSWKLFFITTPLFVLFLTLFGTWMIQESFQSSLEKEIDRCVVENQMFRNSYELTFHSLSEEQQEHTSLRMIVESFHKTVNASEGGTRIYDSDHSLIYQDNELQVTHEIWEELEAAAEQEDENTAGHQIVSQNGQYYIVVLGMCTNAGVWIETMSNVTSVFLERDDLYNTYRIGMLLVSLLAGLLILLVLFFVMRSARKLSRATRQFALGRYDTRADVHSDDEIGRLAEDFNWMAGVMNGQMQKLQNEVQRQEEFTAAFAHELKTPLTSIIGYADTLRSMELSKEESDMCADYIYRQGKRLQSLSYKLLEMAAAEQNKLVFHPTSMPELFQEVARTSEQSLSEKGLTLYVSAEQGVIWGDRELLASLLLNLIDNARKASNPGSRIWLTGNHLLDGYRIIVADEGKGIPPEELSRITEAFYMVDKSRARKEGGAGLGLALCRKILELHQGSWQMESQEGQGLRVTILLGADAAAVQRRRTSRERPGRKRTRQRKLERRRVSRGKLSRG